MGRTKHFKKFVAMMLCLAMIFSCIAPVMAADSYRAAAPNVEFFSETFASVEDAFNFTITADSGDNTVSIVRPHEPPQNDPGIIVRPGQGGLVMPNITRTIERDATNPHVNIGVSNASSSPIEFYLVSFYGFEANSSLEGIIYTNPFSDLILSFVDSGSADEPLVILPGETLQVPLTLFAHLAQYNVYNIPITAFIVGDGGSIQDVTATLTVRITEWEFSLNVQQTAFDPYTLVRTFSMQNTGDFIGDLVVLLEGEVANYAFINNGADQYEMPAGHSLTGIQVIPDLARFRDENIERVEGYLVAMAGGQTIRQPIYFDTQGQEITIINFGRLGLKQSGSQYWDLDILRHEGFTYINEIYDWTNPTNFRLEYEFEVAYNEGNNRIPMGMAISMEPFDPIAHNNILTGAEAYEALYGVLIYPRRYDIGDRIRLQLSILLTEDQLYDFFYDFPYPQYLPTGLSAVAYGTTPFSVRKWFLDIFIETRKEYAEIVSDKALGAFWGDVSKIKTVYGLISDTTQRLHCIFGNPNLSPGQRFGHMVFGAVDIYISCKSLKAGTAAPGVGNWFVNSTAGWINREVQSALGLSVKDCGGSQGAMGIGMRGTPCTKGMTLRTNFTVPSFASEMTSATVSYRAASRHHNLYGPQGTTAWLNGVRIGETRGTIMNVNQVFFLGLPMANINHGGQNQLLRQYHIPYGQSAYRSFMEIILELPYNAEIAFIGNPDSLLEVRSLPDLAVYPENIHLGRWGIVENIIGEESQAQIGSFQS